MSSEEEVTSSEEEIYHFKMEHMACEGGKLYFEASFSVVLLISCGLFVSLFVFLLGGAKKCRYANIQQEGACTSKVVQS